MGSLFWVHYQRKADGQDFHERLTVDGLLKLLAGGGIRLCGMEAADTNNNAVFKRCERRPPYEDGCRA